jgi:hypothetical protein
MYESRTPQMAGTFSVGGPVELAFGGVFARDGRNWSKACPRQTSITGTFVLQHESLLEDEQVKSGP